MKILAIFEYCTLDTILWVQKVKSLIPSLMRGDPIFFERFGDSIDILSPLLPSTAHMSDLDIKDAETTSFVCSWLFALVPSVLLPVHTRAKRMALELPRPDNRDPPLHIFLKSDESQKRLLHS